ncbi:MAG: Mbov_0395 family pilin-like conjugal transfer protein [Candidatus Saccharibacteria bacterium]
MFKNLRKTIAAAVLAVTMIATPLAVPAMASAASDIQGCLSSGASLTVTAGGTCSGGNNTNGADKVNTIVTTIVNIFSAIVGVVSVIMIIYGGFKYISSGGDSGKVTEAKNTIIYAVIGLVIVALAQFIVQFVLSKVIGQ